MECDAVRGNRVEREVRMSEESPNYIIHYWKAMATWLSSYSAIVLHELVPDIALELEREPVVLDRARGLRSTLLRKSGFDDILFTPVISTRFSGDVKRKGNKLIKMTFHT